MELKVLATAVTHLGDQQAQNPVPSAAEGIWSGLGTAEGGGRITLLPGQEEGSSSRITEVQQTHTDPHEQV